MTLRLYTDLPAHFPDIAEIVHVFYPDAQVVPAPEDACDLAHRHSEAGDWLTDTCALAGRTFRWTTRLAGDKWERKRRRKRGLKQCCYYLLRGATGVQPPWGSLTGIRPTRLLYERMAGGETPDMAEAAMIRVFDLREARARLLRETVQTQRGLMDAPENAVDVYVGIPFCTSRCAYCSFFAEAIGRGAKVEPYLAALLRELDAAGEIIVAAGLVPRALYVGGGTPTALSAGQLARLAGRMRALFPRVREWTVEAGRPDTMDRDRLQALRDNGVNRVSVNPQTMNDETLRLIGRAHTAADTERAFAQARAMGFANINMDVIAALPGETAEDFAGTLEAVARLAPESLTVHTLARKHGSRLNEFGFDPTDGAVAEEMVALGAEAAREMGMRPYYLYRQKYVAGNLENVGYAQAGRESVYNIDIMEETVSILALGAGAISKRVFPREGRIERAPGVGDVGQYIARVDEMIARKKRLWGVEG
ncbi:hypothetical protein FACS1894196_0600 [Clostridia bacterium]|nr:hypothetical protein FACS1894196_0600 [Clostridia bacterium]